MKIRLGERGTIVVDSTALAPATCKFCFEDLLDLERPHRICAPCQRFARQDLCLEGLSQEAWDLGLGVDGDEEQLERARARWRRLGWARGLKGDRFDGAVLFNLGIDFTWMGSGLTPLRTFDITVDPVLTGRDAAASLALAILKHLKVESWFDVVETVHLNQPRSSRFRELRITAEHWRQLQACGPGAIFAVTTDGVCEECCWALASLHECVRVPVPAAELVQLKKPAPNSKAPAESQLTSV